MTRTMQFAVGLLSGASLIALGAAGASAGHFKKLSPKHTNYGVSQYNWASVNKETSQCVTVMNPNHVDQIAAVLMYSRPTDQVTKADIDNVAGEEDFVTEIFLGCVAVEVSAHGYLGLPDTSTTSVALGGVLDGDDNWPGCPTNSRDILGDGVPRWAQVIWGPVETVEISNGTGTRRQADGLGGVTLSGQTPDSRTDGVMRSHGLLHPGAFSLPDNDVIAGQREAAIECVCGELGRLFVSGDTFRPFGISCP